MPRRRTQSPKPAPTLQDKVDKVDKVEDDAAVKAFTTLQEAQLSAEEHRSLKREDQQRRELSMSNAINLYVTTARRMDKMMNLPEKSKKQHEMDAKRIFQNPEKFAAFKKEYEHNQGEQTVLKVEFNDVSREEFEKQSDQLKMMFDKLSIANNCHNCHNPSKDGKALSKCMGCQKAYYCSKQCQKEHWKSSHKKSCKEAAAPKS